MDVDTTVIVWIAVIVGGLAAFVVGRFSISSAQEAFGKFAGVSDAAAMIVAGVQQLKETGQIGDNNEAFNVAYAQLKKLFPTLDEGYLKMTIEGAYLLLKKQLESGLIVGDTSYQVGHRGVR